MKTLNQIQEEVGKWPWVNFPHNKPHSALLGVVEEVGELSHAHLKEEQGIRVPEGGFRAAKEDAVGDILIYLLDYCSMQKIDVNKVLNETWDRVSKRDWNKNKKDGGV